MALTHVYGIVAFIYDIGIDGIYYCFYLEHLKISKLRKHQNIITGKNIFTVVEYSTFFNGQIFAEADLCILRVIEVLFSYIYLELK